VLGWTMLNELQSGSGWDQLATWPLSPLPLPRKALNESADRWRLQNSPIINVKASIRPERERERETWEMYLPLTFCYQGHMNDHIVHNGTLQETNREDVLENFGPLWRRLKGKGTECKIHRLWIQEWVTLKRKNLRVRKSEHLEYNRWLCDRRE